MPKAKTTKILKLARELPKLMIKSDRPDELARGFPEISKRRKSLFRRSDQAWERREAIVSRILSTTPKDTDDAIALLALAHGHAWLIDRDLECLSRKAGRRVADTKRIQRNVKILRWAVNGALAQFVGDFDLASIRAEDAIEWTAEK